MLILCAIMLMIALTSCANDEGDSLENQGDPEQNGDAGEAVDAPDDTPEDALVDPLDGSVFGIAFSSFPPDTVMIRIPGLDDVTWAELFVYMRSMIGDLSEFFAGDPIDWSTPWNDEISFADWVMQFAIGEALVNKAFEYGARLHNVSFSEGDWALVREEISFFIADWGGEEEFSKMIWEERGFHSLELFEKMHSFGRRGELLLKAIYGEELEMISDREVAEFIADDGFIMAKHILLFKQDHGGAPDADERIEEILAVLNAYDGEDFEAFFDDVLLTYSEDFEGHDLFPHGFLFLYGGLTQYFYEVAVSLEINEISGIVEGSDSYHIIYRIPINYDVVPINSFMDGDFRTLRMMVAFAKFESLLDDWADLLEPEFTDEFESIDVSVMFGGA